MTRVIQKWMDGGTVGSMGWKNRGPPGEKMGSER